MLFFWLQYGRFLDRQNKYEDAVICFRTGLSLYETPHILHSLGHVLLKKYIHDRLVDDSEMQEGLNILFSHLNLYGRIDAYFATTLLDMISQIIGNGKVEKHIIDMATDVINMSSHHISNREYNRALQKFIYIRKDIIEK